jgi:mono/diheme cytochrome c family protein
MSSVSSLRSSLFTLCACRTIPEQFFLSTRLRADWAALVYKRGMSAARMYRQLLIVALFLGLAQSILFAQDSPHNASLRNGAYTAEQAQEGKAIYQERCAMCHGDALEGRGQNSPLAGTAFLKNWDGLTVADLFMKTIVMMPAMNPGTLTPKETAEVLAYILSMNKFPAGKTELPSDPKSLEMIHIAKP